MGKPRLLVMASTFPKSPGDGTPGFVLDLAKEQAKEFEVLILTPFVSGAKRFELIGDIKVIRYRYWPFAHKLADGGILDNLKSNPSSWLEVPFLFLGLILATWKANVSFKPDLIHAHWIIPQGLVAAKLKGKAKLLVTVHGGDIYALNGGDLPRLKSWALEKADAVTTVNTDMKKQLVSWLVPEQKISVQPMGIKLSSFSAQRERDLKLFVAVGRLVEKKGFSQLIEAVSEGIKSGQIAPDVRIQIAGDGPLKARFEREAQGLPIDFLGQQGAEQVAQLLAQCGTFLLPSVVAASGDREGLPVTLLEAAAAGCFIIASELPGVTQVVEHRISGLLVQPGDVSNLLEAIATAIGDHDLRERCAAEAKKRSVSFSLERVGSAYRQILRELA